MLLTVRCRLVWTRMPYTHLQVWLPTNFTVLSENFHIHWNFLQNCHSATLTNFLCYTQISPVQGKLAYWYFRLVRRLPPHSHHRIILHCSVYYSPTTRILLLIALWWYTMRLCWEFLPSGAHSHDHQRIIPANISTETISIPHLSARLKNRSALS